MYAYKIKKFTYFFLTTLCSEDLPLFHKIQDQQVGGLPLIQLKEIGYRLDKKGEMQGKYLKKT